MKVPYAFVTLFFLLKLSYKTCECQSGVSLKQIRFQVLNKQPFTDSDRQVADQISKNIKNTTEILANHVKNKVSNGLFIDNQAQGRLYFDINKFFNVLFKIIPPGVKETIIAVTAICGKPIE